MLPPVWPMGARVLPGIKTRGEIHRKTSELVLSGIFPLVSCALTPRATACGKRGFRAAIFRIACPQSRFARRYFAHSRPAKLACPGAVAYAIQLTAASCFFDKLCCLRNWRGLGVSSARKTFPWDGFQRETGRKAPDSSGPFGAGFRGPQRPEIDPVDQFQRGRAGRPRIA